MKRSNENSNYQSGFGNFFATEQVADALPKGQNSPQKGNHGLYAEQLSGSNFTALRKENFRTWCYRIRPSVVHAGTYESVQLKTFASTPFAAATSPEPFRWNPPAIPSGKVEFFESFVTFAGNGKVEENWGSAVHLYAATETRADLFFCNSDGDFLFVPETGSLFFKTELGELLVGPEEIAVIPRGVKFQIELPDGNARGYVCENYGPHFKLPELGPIGSNGLASPRDFLAPVAKGAEKKGPFQLLNKFQGSFWSTTVEYSPLDVIAWHGNYYPYKYDLKNFNTIGTVSFDHPDPSIFTVLTSQDNLGRINVDFAIFPPRWMVAEHTFRPPYYHRNVMSEFMGLVTGKYDAKPNGFSPGGSSLHNCMTGHGPDAEAFQVATNKDLKPERYENTMAFMFESSQVYRVTEAAWKSPLRQKDYADCWKGLKGLFKS